MSTEENMTIDERYKYLRKMQPHCRKAESFDYICPERLTPNLPWMAEMLDAHGESRTMPERCVNRNSSASRPWPAACVVFARTKPVSYTEVPRKPTKSPARSRSTSFPGMSKDRGASRQELHARNVSPDPLEQLEQWFQEAKHAGVDLPGAMTLATATKAGVPSARMVILRGLDERGFVFYTNYDSQKGRELAENPRAALVFYWRELGRQVRVAGHVSRVSREESERYFRGRPRGAQLAAWASDQSEVIPSREALEERLEQVRTEYAGEEVPLPPDWGGLQVAPDRIEFWQQRPDRLHDRLRYTRQVDGEWRIERLAP